MRQSSVVRVVACMAAALAFGIACSAAQNSTPDRSANPIPRTSDGKPDLSGIWQGRELDIKNFTLEQEERTSAQRVANPGGGLPYTEEALETVRQFTEADDPALRCIPSGIPRQSPAGAVPLQIVQTPGQIVILYEAQHRYRIFPTDGRPHPVDWYPTYMGDSVGQWDGDTLVVDVIGFNDKTWIHTLGTFHTEDMHVVERYYLSDADTLEYQATVEDPNVLTEPWTKTVTWRRRPAADRLRESICVDTQDYQYFREVFDAKEN